MSKMVSVAVLVLLALFVFGCSDAIQEGPRFHANEDIEKQINNSGIGVPDAAEVDLVEVMGMYRNSYHASLKKLVEHYAKSGDATKLYWAKSELKSYRKMNKYMYIMPAVIAGPDLKAIDLIIEADELYEEAEKLYKEANRLVVIVDKDKLRLALSKFNEVIGMYPTSDKIDDAAYRAGRIYDHFGDYRIAAIYYQRTFQWNEDTKYPARSRVAYVMDKRLNQKEKALAFYQLAYKYEKHYPNNVEYARNRILELTKPDEKLDNDTTALPGDGVKIEDIELPSDK